MAASKYKRITVSFTDADEDIVTYLKNLKASGKTSEFVREAIREKINKEKSSQGGNVITEDMVRRIVSEMLPKEPIPPTTRSVEEKTKYVKEEAKENDVDEAILNAMDSYDF